MSIRFDDQVAIVTGAGGGIGKQHALELARRGAKVVVNDLGGGVDGTGTSDASEAVVDQILTEGGEAIANGASVTDLDAIKDMTEQVVSKWGKIDILVNNAGILRDKTFHNVSMDDFNLVMDVHEDTFGRSDHVTFRNLGAQTIFHLGAYDEDYSAYHSPTDTFDNMIEEVGGPEELKKSIQYVLWAAFLEFILADQTPEVRNVDV